MKPILRYFGAKWALADWIVEHLPPHACFVEPFGGSAAVLLTKTPSRHEVYNDIDLEVVEFFEVLRERAGDLAEAIALTPYSRAELEQSYQRADDPFERARRFLVRSWQTRSGFRRMGGSSWRYDRTWHSGASALQQWRRVAPRLAAVAARLLEVQIESADWLSVVERFDAPTTLVYLDPPYLRETRGAKYEYRHELDDAGHAVLLERARTLESMVVISGYPSPMYDDALVDWAHVDIRAQINNGKFRTERLWLSPAAVAAGAGRQGRLAL